MGVNLRKIEPASEGTRLGVLSPAFPSVVSGKSFRAKRSRTAYVVSISNPANFKHASSQVITRAFAPLFINSRAVEPLKRFRAHTFVFWFEGAGAMLPPIQLAEGPRTFPEPIQQGP